jgi:hypothetical protein
VIAFDSPIAGMRNAAPSPAPAAGNLEFRFEWRQDA